MRNDPGGRPSPRSGNPRRALVVRGNEPCNRDTVSIVAVHQTTTSIFQPASPINDSTLPIDQSPLSIHQSATSIFHSALPIIHPVAWIHQSDFEIAPFVGVRHSFDFTNSHDISADRSSHDAGRSLHSVDPSIRSGDLSPDYVDRASTLGGSPLGFADRSLRFANRSIGCVDRAL